MAVRLSAARPLGTSPERATVGAGTIEIWCEASGISMFETRLLVRVEVKMKTVRNPARPKNVGRAASAGVGGPAGQMVAWRLLYCILVKPNNRSPHFSQQAGRYLVRVEDSVSYLSASGKNVAISNWMIYL
jgi:hypothetical protein